MIGTNAVVFIQTSRLGKTERNFASITRAIRRSVEDAKSAQFGTADLVHAHYSMLDAANKGNCICVLPPQGCLTVNGNTG